MKAIIPAAGLGTRFLPVTKVVPKEMLPIGAKPALELIVEEAKSAGADEIILVISPGKELIRSYFKDDPSIRFVYQSEQKGLGHAILMAESAFTDASRSQPVLILLGDALVVGCNAAKEMAAVSAANGGASVIGVERVPREKVSRYGIIKPRRLRSETEVEVEDMIEKPAIEEAPSDFAVAGRYLLSARIFDCLKTQTPGKGGEIQLTDAIRRMIAQPSTLNPQPPTVLAYIYPGKRQDIGNPDGYFKALEAYRSWKS